MWESLTPVLPVVVALVLVAINVAAASARIVVLGLVLFGLVAGHRLAEHELDRLRRLLVWAAGLGALTLVVATTQKIAALDWAPVEAPQQAADLVARTLAMLAGLALAAGLTLRHRIAPALGGAGAVLLLQAGPGGFVEMMHLAALGLWFGALLPLSWAADRGDRAAAGLLEDAAVWGAGPIAVTLFTGLILARPWLWGAPQAGLAEALAVAATVLALLAAALAIRHRFVLLPELIAGAPLAAERCVWSSRVEAGLLALAVLFAGAHTSVS